VPLWLEEGPSAPRSDPPTPQPCPPILILMALGPISDAAEFPLLLDVDVVVPSPPSPPCPEYVFDIYIYIST